MPPQLWIGLIILGSLLLFGWMKRRAIALWTMETIIYHWFCRRVLPRLKYWPCHGLSLSAILRGYGTLRPGDIVVVLRSYTVASLLTPGVWTHVAFCIRWYDKMGDGNELVEAVASGVQEASWLEACQSSHRICILRPQVDDYYRTLMIERAKSFIGVPYDRHFRLGWKSLYCSELPYAADPHNRCGVRASTMACLGWPYIRPDDWLEAKHVQKVWDSEGVRPLV